MLQNMRRLHPRGAANRGICVDRDGAMLGPDCVLVGRTQHGFRPLERESASTIQKWILGATPDMDWLFHQCRRIADALNKGEITLAQIHGLYIPVEKLDHRTLDRLALMNVGKAGFNPDEPRIPTGQPHAGEWTIGGANEAGADTSDGTPDDGSGGGNDSVGWTDAGGGGNSASSQTGDGTALAPALTVLSSDDLSAPADTFVEDGQAMSNNNFPISLEIAQPTAATSPNEPVMQYQMLGTGSVAAAESAAASLLNGLSAQVLAALAQLLARMTGPTAFFGILFIPSNGDLVITGAVAGAPDLTVSYDRDTGVVRVWQADNSGAKTLLDTGHIGVDGRFYDAAGTAVGAAIANGAVIDPATLPAYRSQSSSAGINIGSQAIADNANQPKLCPDPTFENIAGRSDRTIAYQSQITGLPPGLEIVFNGERYDGCRPENGDLLEAKGEGYENFMDGPDTWKSWFSKLADIEQQIYDHALYSSGRTVEYHFAEKPVADYFRAYAAGLYPNIVVFYTPPGYRP